MIYAVYGLIAFVVVSLILSNVRIVRQSEAYVIERLGAFKTTWGTGLHFKIPIVDAVAKKVSLKERVADFDPQPVITKDNVTIDIDTVVYYQITDPKLYTYGVERPLMAIENLTATTLRNIIGDLELDQTLTSRDTVNTQLRVVLDEATDPWGIKINRVELKNITPPKQITDSMEKQMKAERERRESILKAEGDKQSAILVAEGRKQSIILDAQAEKESAILRAEAEKQKRIAEAEGQAEAIRIVQEATAKGIEALNLSKPTKEVLTLKSLEAFTKVADGQSTKIIIPSEIQNLGGLITSIKELSTDEKKDLTKEISEDEDEY